MVEKATGRGSWSRQGNSRWGSWQPGRKGEDDAERRGKGKGNKGKTKGKKGKKSAWTDKPAGDTKEGEPAQWRMIPMRLLVRILCVRCLALDICVPWSPLLRGDGKDPLASRRSQRRWCPPHQVILLQLLGRKLIVSRTMLSRSKPWRDGRWGSLSHRIQWLTMQCAKTPIWLRIQCKPVPMALEVEMTDPCAHIQMWSGAIGTACKSSENSWLMALQEDKLLLEVRDFSQPSAWMRSSELFPLPVDFDGCPCDQAKGRVAGGSKAWLQLVSYSLNVLAGKKPPFPKRRSSACVGRVVKNLEDRIKRFLDRCGPVPLNVEQLWEDIKIKQVNYQGEEVGNPVPLSFEQILPSIPQQGHGASVDLTPLLCGRARFLVQHPEHCLLEETEKGPGRNKARVHIAPGEELKVWKLLEERGIIDWLPLSDVYCDSEGPFLSGLFGVPKAGRFCAS